MVAVLLAALRVTARGLDVAVSPRANPDVAPGRRDCQSPDPFLHVRLTELRPVGSGVRESFSRLPAPYARSGIGNISQARRFGGVLRIDNCLHAIRRIGQQNRSPPSATSNEPLRTGFHKEGDAQTAPPVIMDRPSAPPGTAGVSGAPTRPLLVRYPTNARTGTKCANRNPPRFGTFIPDKGDIRLEPPNGCNVIGEIPSCELSGG